MPANSRWDLIRRLRVKETGPRIAFHQLLDILGSHSTGTAAWALYFLLWSEVWEFQQSV